MKMVKSLLLLGYSSIEMTSNQAVPRRGLSKYTIIEGNGDLDGGTVL